MNRKGKSADDPVERFSRVIEQLVRRLRSVASVGGISPSVASALSRLEAEGPLRITELARAEGVSQPAMTQLVGRMENDGFVERTTPQGDRRGVLIAPTARGREVFSRRRARRSDYLHELLESLEPADRAAIEAALPALERLVSAAAQQPSLPMRGTATR
ncbi:MarR family winged helix-turn-helix transcriptional regulator [Sinomonas susongensis]|uniref:MarR family winged helix-turn-helix transcriptional regulator n=1 Tax=Sinomonas susongensis TaxID=1324851 RepID=UPI001108A572|nr:MarR family transcriptional regulator [Sinomonas susongensis]